MNIPNNSLTQKIRYITPMGIVMHYEYKTENTCTQFISFDIEGNIVRNISFTGGCNGNLKAISKLLDGATAEEIEAKLLGNTCGRRPTSCTDQLAIAVRKAYNKYMSE